MARRRAFRCVPEFNPPASPRKSLVISGQVSGKLTFASRFTCMVLLLAHLVWAGRAMAAGPRCRIETSFHRRFHDSPDRLRNYKMIHLAHPVCVPDQFRAFKHETVRRGLGVASRQGPVVPLACPHTGGLGTGGRPLHHEQLCLGVWDWSGKHRMR